MAKLGKGTFRNINVPPGTSNICSSINTLPALLLLHALFCKRFFLRYRGYVAVGFPTEIGLVVPEFTSANQSEPSDLHPSEALEQLC
jgi:hypothetical protein